MSIYKSITNNPLGVREVGLSGAMLAWRFGMSQPGVVYAVKRGERIAEEKGYRLI